MKNHLNLATTDLAKSIEFYSILLDAKPAKVLSDYALFITAQPPLELALDAVESKPRISDDHYGIFVDTTEEVERAIRRLENAKLVSLIEREQTCCYANQTKVWAIDPMGRRWEIYTVHEETDEWGSGDGARCRETTGMSAACCTA
jgi:catechol 2,3-dioxygenase-like lactoylglutathione lyase family enzyme